MVVVVLGSVLGATLAFVIGRTIGRKTMEERAAKSPRFAAIDAAVAENGFKIVLLSRLSPIFPFNLLNYLYSVTKVRFDHYVIGSLVGMFPGTLLYVYLGTLIGDLPALLRGEFEGGVWQQVMMGGGLVVTIILTLYIAHVAKTAIAQYVPDDAENPVELADDAEARQDSATATAQG